MKEAGGERCIDFVEQFEEHHADPISHREQPIAAGMGEFFHQSFAAELRQFIAYGAERALAAARASASAIPTCSSEVVKVSPATT